MSTDTSNRHQQILSLLCERGDTSVEVLTRAFGVSEATIRRDLSGLEAQGRLDRILGGARYREPASLVVRTFSEKRQRMQPQKERIARAAAKLVEPGMVVAFDSGTTVWRIAAALQTQVPLTVFTASLPAIEELGGIEGVNLFCTGGEFRADNLDFVGPVALEAFDRLHADIAFLGADSIIGGRGVFAADESGAAMLGKLSSIADRVVVAADHEKFHIALPFLGVANDEIDTLITDAELDDETRQLLESEPYRVLIAN